MLLYFLMCVYTQVCVHLQLFTKFNLLSPHFSYECVIAHTLLKSRYKHTKVSEYDKEIPQSHTADQPTAPRGEPHNTNSHKIYQEDNQNKATSSFFPIKMSTKLEGTLSTE